MSDEDEIRGLVVDSASRIFSDLCDPQTVNHAPDSSWKEPFWSELEANGLTLAWVPEENGGAGAGIGAGFDVLEVSGRFAVPVPLAETMVAGWLLASAGLDIPQGAMTVAPVQWRDRGEITANGAISGRFGKVAFAPQAEHVAVMAAGHDGPAVALLRAGDCKIEPGETIAGDEQGTLVCDGVAPLAFASLDTGNDNVAMLMGAAARAVQIAGALHAVLDMTVAYAGEREAFGRPIGKFQAIQHSLAKLAGEAAAASAAAGSAADAIERAGRFEDEVFLEVASAKIRAGEAAGEAAAIAHQVFAAIGFTQEHILHRYTRRLWAWRDDFGNESEWAERLGRHVCANGADELWPMLAAR